MSEIINFQTPYRFAVYEHKIQSQKELSSIRMIVIRNQSNQVIQYTGLEEFSYPYTGQRPKITVRTKSELVYICEALNYIFANNRVKRIADITADMIFDFFGYYCNTPKGISNDIMLAQQSLDNCVRHVSHFFSNLAATYPTKITPEELLNYVETKANKHSQRIKRRYTPIYNPKRPHSYDVSLLRDMPLAAANRLVELATIYDPMIAFAIVLQLSAGLRPSCICNVRQADSPISTKPGISLTFIGSGISGNGELTPENVFPKSNKRVSWICDLGHKWEAKISHRTDGQGCPYCAGQKPIPSETDLETLEPAISRQWHPSQNGDRRPSEFTRFSHFGAMWLCDNGHEYSAPIYRRSRGCGCPVCDGKSILPGVNDLASRAPSLAKEWDWENNIDDTPETVALHANRKFYWICQKCGHSWKASPNNRVAGKGCPNCAGHTVFPEVNSFAAVNPQMIDQWDLEKNYPLTAWDVAAYDNRDYHWLCKNGHSFSASPANRTKGTACPYCQGKLPVVGVNDFIKVCPTAAREWHPDKNEGALPEHFLPNSHKEVWWKCSKGHEWKASIESRTRGAQCKECSKRRTTHHYIL